MSNYNEAYRSYYSDISRRVNPSGRQYNSTSVEDLIRKSKKPKKNYFVNLFVKQLIGAITLLILAITIKMSPSSEAQSVYKTSKEIVSGSYDFTPMIEEIKQFDISEYINKIDESE